MRIFGSTSYFIYIVTNKNRTVLYTGVTNDLARRLAEHEDSASSIYSASFTGKYKAYFLLYYEEFENVLDAIAREKEIKGWRRSKKEELINSLNAEWKFLNDDF